MDNLGTAMILLGFSIFIFAVVYKLRDTKKRKRKKVNFLKVAGIALIAFGIYELPFGVMEVYGITQSALHLSLLENYVVCYLHSSHCDRHIALQEGKMNKKRKNFRNMRKRRARVKEGMP